MNKRGNILGSLLVGVMFFAAAMLLMNFVLPEVSLARSVTGVDCSSTNLTDGSKVTCLGIDLVVPLLLITILSATVGRIAGEFV